MELDPRFGKFALGQLHLRYDEDLDLSIDTQEVSVDLLTRENFPEEYQAMYTDIRDETA